MSDQWSSKNLSIDPTPYVTTRGHLLLMPAESFHLERPTPSSIRFRIEPTRYLAYLKSFLLFLLFQPFVFIGLLFNMEEDQFWEAVAMGINPAKWPEIAAQWQSTGDRTLILNFMVVFTLLVFGLLVFQALKIRRLDGMEVDGFQRTITRRGKLLATVRNDALLNVTRKPSLRTGDAGAVYRVAAVTPDREVLLAESRDRWEIEDAAVAVAEVMGVPVRANYECRFSEEGQLVSSA